MKKTTLFITIVILVFLSYIAIYRIYMSNYYKSWFINNITYSGFDIDTTTQSKTAENPFVQTITFPIESQDSFKITLTEWHLLSFFVWYSFLWINEYKPIDIWSDDWQSFLIDPNQNFKFSTEVWKQHFIRNSVFDKGWKTKSIIMQVATNSWWYVKITKNDLEN